MSQKTKIFITGATGYIGGSILQRLLKHPDASSFEITAIVRNPQKAEKFNEFGVNASVGSFSDAKLLEDLTAAADIVIDTLLESNGRIQVDSDRLEGAKIMLRGLKRKYQATGQPPIFIHTSGTGLLSDGEADFRTSAVVWNDADPDQLEKLLPTAQHRDVDLEIIQADKEGYVKAYLVAPSVIYGLASGELVDAGLMNKHSILIPLFVNIALKRGRAGVIGNGSGVWLNVDIDEVTDLYLIIFDKVRQNPDFIGHGREGYYFGENGEYSVYDVSKEIGRILVELGRNSDAEPTTLSQEEIDKYLDGTILFGTNARGEGNRSRSLGWKPTKTTKHMIASIRSELDEMLKAQ